MDSIAKLVRLIVYAKLKIHVIIVFKGMHYQLIKQNVYSALVHPSTMLPVMTVVAIAKIQVKLALTVTKLVIKVSFFR